MVKLRPEGTGSLTKVNQVLKPICHSLFGMLTRLETLVSLVIASQKSERQMVLNQLPGQLKAVNQVLI